MRIGHLGLGSDSRTHRRTRARTGAAGGICAAARRGGARFPARFASGIRTGTYGSMQADLQIDWARNCHACKHGRQPNSNRHQPATTAHSFSPCQRFAHDRRHAERSQQSARTHDYPYLARNQRGYTHPLPTHQRGVLGSHSTSTPLPCGSKNQVVRILSCRTSYAANEAVNRLRAGWRGYFLATSESGEFVLLLRQLTYGHR